MLELADNIKTVMITISHMFRVKRKYRRYFKKSSLISRDENYNSKDFLVR